MNRIFKTEDGKYESSSFEGLMNKIVDDIKDEMDPEEFQRLEDAFEEEGFGDNPPSENGDWMQGQ